MIGKQLAHYEITDLLGKGGMGEVYRARDSKLGREVAIKVIPREFSDDPERIARFESEARTLAALQHPNVASIFGLEQADGIRFLVMEFVDGEDLSERLKRGRIPHEEALDIACQISEGLESAHGNGIIHRDLKPANIVLTVDHHAKILDFGLARAYLGDPQAPDSADSPTITAGMTQEGIILGTAAYMSPEQAMGKPLDARSDIWAFGCVLYEMLTGQRPFRGEAVSDTLASVLKDEPDWTALPPDTSARLERTLRRCLVKDRRRRLHHIADARLELLEDQSEDHPAKTPRSRLPMWSWGMLIALALAAALFTGSQLGEKAPVVPESPLRKFAISVPGLSSTDWTHPVISPDGKRLAFRIDNRLMVRDLGSLTSRAVTGGEEGNAPFWSPDGAWLAFARESKLWKVPAAGGSPVMLCDLPNQGKLMSGAWSNRDRIAISIWRDAIYELPAHGGDSWVRLEPDSTIGSDFQSILYLPDGETLLATPHPMNKWSNSGVNMGKVIAARDGEVRVVLGEGESIHCHSITWSPSGHLIYNRTWHNRGIWAVPFSIDLLVPTGEPFLVAADGDYPSVAGDGTLAYLPVEQEFEYELVWVDRRGVVLGTVGKPAISLGRPSLSPDGTRVAYHAKPDAGLRLEIYARDLTGEVPVRLTFSGGWSYPEWSPDGRLLIFSYGNKIAAKSADGSGELQQLFLGSQPSITPDGHNVIYHYFQEGKELRDVLIRPLDGSDEPVVLVGGAMEEEGRLSPAGDYLAYQSDETGTDEIYLTSYPGGEGKWQLSTQGGRDMRWVGDGNELIYREPGGPFMSVTIRRDPKLHIAEPVVLFEMEGNELVDPAQGFDVSPNGERLLMVRRIPVEGDGSSIVILQNWLANF